MPRFVSVGGRFKHRQRQPFSDILSNDKFMTVDLGFNERGWRYYQSKPFHNAYGWPTAIHRSVYGRRQK